MALADFSRASALGFEQGQQMQEGQNPLGTFVRSMLADYKQKKAMESEYGMKTALNQQEYGMKKDLAVEEAKLRQQFPSPFEALMAKQMSGDMGNAPASTEEEAKAQIPSGENPEDYNLKVETRSLRGIPQSIYRPEKKPLVQPAQQKELNQIRQTRILLERNLDKLKNNPQFQKFIGPGIVQRPGAMADVIAQMGGAPKDFVTFKADVDKAFQKYRKEVTGVQAGYPELQWLAPDLPKTTDTSDNFISKTESSIEQLKQAEEQLYDTWNKAGFSTGKLREGTKGNLIQEQSKQLDESTARSILQEAGGDRIKARELAKKRGYTF